MTDTEDDEIPTIDMTSEVDQQFMDAETGQGEHDPHAKYEQVLKRYEENGWDPEEIGLEPPEGYEGNGERAKTADPSGEP